MRPNRKGLAATPDKIHNDPGTPPGQRRWKDFKEVLNRIRQLEAERNAGYNLDHGARDRHPGFQHGYISHHKLYP